MTGRDVTKLSAAGLALLTFPLFVLCAAAIVIVAGCRSGPITPEPSPVPDPSGPPCERAERRAEQLHCIERGDAALFLETCARYSTADGDNRWDTACMSTPSVATCEAFLACRGGQ